MTAWGRGGAGVRELLTIFMIEKIVKLFNGKVSVFQVKRGCICYLMKTFS